MKASKLIKEQDSVERRVLSAAKEKAIKENREMTGSDIIYTMLEYMDQFEDLLAANQNAIKGLQKDKSAIIIPE